MSDTRERIARINADYRAGLITNHARHELIRKELQHVARTAR